MVNISAGLSGSGYTAIFFALLLTSFPAGASVTYVFEVTGLPDSSFHMPLNAEIIFTDEAVSQGLAAEADIESLRITAGATLEDGAPINMAHRHLAFTDFTVTFSEDRENITSIGATLDPGGSVEDYWLFRISNPPLPVEPDVFEHLCYLRHDSLRVETGLFPVPIDFHISTFEGGWRRYSPSPFREFYEVYLSCFPHCPLPWFLLALIAIFFAGLAYFVRCRISR